MKVNNLPDEDVNIHLCFITDETYVRPTRVAMESLKANRKVDAKYVAHVICRGVQDDGIAELEKAGTEDFAVEIIRRDELPVDPETISLVRHVSPTAIFKFFIPELFPALDKILYLDSDILILDDLASLWEEDVSGVYAAVVCDNQTIIGHEGHLKWLGFAHEKYFNSGVMLLNLDKMRNDEITSRLMEYRISGKNRFMDQDALNVVFDNCVRFVPVRYNCLNWLFLTCTLDQLRECFGESQIGQTVEQTMDIAAVLHIGGSEKPWLCELPYYTPLYRKYAALAGWELEFPKVSVVMPVYNSSKHLREALYSVCSQTLKELDIVCVDNGSKDSSLDILREFAAFDKRVRILKAPRKGAGTCRNFGIAHARGKYVGFLDSDDFIDFDYFEKLYSKAEETGDDVVMTARVVESDVFGRTKKPKAMGHKGRDEIKSARERGDIILTTGVVWNKIYRRQFLLDNKIRFSESPCAGEDKLFDFGVLLAANKISVVKDACYHYRQSGDTSESFRNKGRESFAIIDFYRDIKALIDSWPMGERTRNVWRSIAKRVRDAEFRMFAGRMDPKVRGDFTGVCVEAFYDDASSRKIQNLVVSLTSFPARIQTVHRTIKTILGQSVRPEKTILWLAPSQFPNRRGDLPQELKELTRYGLEIKWCDDIRSYKKLIPTLKLYPCKTIVTADDDVLYPRFWLEKLWQEHIKHPTSVIVHRARKIEHDGRAIKPYRQWPILTSAMKPERFLVLQTGIGGVLYPVGCFTEEIFNEKVFREVAPNADDIWFWAMAVLNGKCVRQVYSYERTFPAIEGTQEVSLSQKNYSDGENDWQLQAVLKRYPAIFRALRMEMRGHKKKRRRAIDWDWLNMFVPHILVCRRFKKQCGRAMDVSATYYRSFPERALNFAKKILPLGIAKLAMKLDLWLLNLFSPGRYEIRRNMATIASSMFFDVDWYLERYPDVRKSRINPWMHYCKYGWKEGRSPSPIFDGPAYLRKHPDVAKAKINPLVHFLRFGKIGGRFRPIPLKSAVTDEFKASVALRSGLFNPAWYAKYAMLPSSLGRLELAKHYIASPSSAAFPPSRYFNGPRYLYLSPDVAEHKMNPLWHYLMFGKYEGRGIDVVETAKPPRFSVVMATYNRGFCVCDAIDSLMRQTYGHFELIIVDDGSSDETENVVKSRFSKQIKSGTMVYSKILHSGVSKARNVALGLARHEWIAYLDSDNIVDKDWLETFVNGINTFPEAVNLYAKFLRRESEVVVGDAFDLARLMKANYIDLGVYAHKRKLIEECGGFDEQMTRLVDWDFIARQAKAHTPQFLDKIIMRYNDANEFPRITNSESFADNLERFRKNHGRWAQA